MPLRQSSIINGFPFLLGAFLTTFAQSQDGSPTNDFDVTLPSDTSFYSEEPVFLETFVVTATRTQADPHQIPYTVAVITEEELERDLVRNLPEALEQTPGVLVQKTANGQGSPFIRGFTGYRTLALIDGVRYNHSVFRDGPNEYFALIDSQSLAGIELVQGPGSVLYGSDAVGGALNLRTQAANFHSEAPGQFFQHGSSFYRYSSAENSHLGRLEYQTGVGGKWGLHLGGTGKDFGDVRAADLGRQSFTGYEEWAYDARLDLQLNDLWALTLAHQQLAQDDVWRTHSSIFGVSFAGTTIGSDRVRLKDQRRSLTYMKLRGEGLEGPVDAVSLTTSYQTTDERGRRVRNTGRLQLEDFNSGMWGVDLQLESKTFLGRFVYGLDYYEDHVDSSRTDFNPDGTLREKAIQGPVGDDATYGLLGVYLQDTIDVGDRFDLILGGRFTHVGAEIGRLEDPVTGRPTSFSDSWENVVGSARAIYDLDAGGRHKIFVGASQSFRAPNVADLSRFAASRTDLIETASTDLEPEEFVTYEVGLKHQSEILSSGLSLFRTDLSNYITSTPTGRIVDGLREVTKQNSSEGYVQGVEFFASYKLGRGFDLFGNVTWLEGEADVFLDPETKVGVREPLSRIQPVIGTGGIRWMGPGERFWTELTVTAAGEATQLNTGDRGDTQRIPPGGTPGYTLMDLGFGWIARDDVTFYGRLDNLLDEAYRAHGSGSNEPGFGGTVGMKVSF